MTTAVADPRYPIGKFSRPETITPEHRKEAIAEIAALPEKLSAALARLSEAQLDTAYREGGWTVRQLVHHIADSHLNAITRLKLALTEEKPVIRPYDEKAWAELPDNSLDVEVSVNLLKALHTRWATVLATLDDAQWQRLLQHPEQPAPWTVEHLTLIYAWHSKHHVAHIRLLTQQD
ncbi:MAG: putative metal-dependent hydrolase [Acidobacteriaceae bacterium]|nr:putative metal-dependent hydrolase [Acidobacteriaceae bacterium]